MAGPETRIVYAANWAGPLQIFAADPSGRAPLGQVTFARVAEPCRNPAGCGFFRPTPSPDGRWIVYSTAVPEPIEFQLQMTWLAHADGSDARPIGPIAPVWSPDSRRLAFVEQGAIHVRTTAGADRQVHVNVTGDVQQVAWSPDGDLAFVDARGLVVVHAKRERLLVPGLTGALAWSGGRIAYGSHDGIRVVAPPKKPRLAYATNSSGALELALTPDGRRLAFTFGAAIRIVDTSSFRVTSPRAAGHDIAWSPDGRSLLYVEGDRGDSDAVQTGDVKAVTQDGRVRTLVSASGPHGGQILDAAWTTAPGNVHYRPAQPLDGVFAGAPVQEIAADGARVAYIACGAISVWTPSTGAVDVAAPSPVCSSPTSRVHTYSLGLAGDRVAWVQKTAGNCYGWDAHEATIGSAPVTTDKGSGCLGHPPQNGVGTIVGAGSLLVRSHWSFHYGNGNAVIDSQAIEAIGTQGCPCSVLSSSTGPYTPLDVDGGRIVVSGTNETRILYGDGSIALSIRVPTLAAQLSGSDLVLAVGDQLRTYDAASGELRSTWQLPAQPVGHPCDLYGDPTCALVPKVVLDDVSHGLAAFETGGEVHVLRLTDGRDTELGPGSSPRFMDSGLVYADGARLHLVGYPRLPS